MSGVWRFGYGSNIGLKNLQKKNLNPERVVAGAILGWDLYFKKGYSPYVEPAWAGVRTHADGERGQLHGTAFLISEEEAAGLDTQERGYNVLPTKFIAYDGEVVEAVGLYVGKNGTGGGPEALPSLRYLRLMQNGAREAGLAQEWIQRLAATPHYVTPPEVRHKSMRLIEEFEADAARKNVVWTAEELSKHDGSHPDRPVHISSMGYIVKAHPKHPAFGSWKGHDITRRNLLQFNGKNLDTADIRVGQPGYPGPLPDVSRWSAEEKEFVFQNLDSLLYPGGIIVGRLKAFADANEG